ncbi:MAG: hypothetical protein H0U51_09520 [Propionibacteriales bacterium]|nr:hypothetical protein [Propionibacteriales bacterium]
MTFASVGSLVLAGTLLTAALAKRRAPTQFRSILRDLVPGPLVQPLAVVVPAAEALIAALIIAGVATLLSAAAALILVIAFSVALARMWQLGITQDCGCFGEASHASTPASGLLRNAVLAACAVALIGWPPSATWFSDTPSLLVHIVAVAGLFGVWTLTLLLVERRALLIDGEVTL